MDTEVRAGHQLALTLPSGLESTVDLNQNPVPQHDGITTWQLRLIAFVTTVTEPVLM